MLYRVEPQYNEKKDNDDDTTHELIPGDEHLHNSELNYFDDQTMKKIKCCIVYYFQFHVCYSLSDCNMLNIQRDQETVPSKKFLVVSIV